MTSERPGLPQTPSKALGREVAYASARANGASSGATAGALARYGWTGVPGTVAEWELAAGAFFDLAVIVDDFIDRIMVDDRLNANLRVDEADHRVLPPGFKYLVTEQLCEAAGGPQRYTGRSMKDSHRDMLITAEEWEAFIDDLNQTLDKFEVPQQERSEVLAIIDSIRDDIVVGDESEAEPVSGQCWGRRSVSQGSGSAGFVGRAGQRWSCCPIGGGPTTSLSVIDAAGGRGSTATLPGYHAGRPPGNSGMR